MAEDARKIKLLILTQKVDNDDPVLGFFHHWIEEFAKECQSIIVVCLEKGESKLPNNVEVLSLGKPAQGWSSLGRERLLQKFSAFLNFYKYIWQKRDNYDSIFVHMSPIFVVLGGSLWRILGKKVILWYTHKSVDLKLKIAEKFVNKVFTASKESFRLNTKKVEVVGHGIDIKKFEARSTKHEAQEKYRIITVGRVAPVKNYEALIETARILKDRNFSFSLKIAGAPILEKDNKYLINLNKLLASYALSGLVEFVGPVSYKTIEEFYKKGDLFINLSDTGSIDKVVLEAMASGLKVLTSNEAFKGILSGEYFTEKEPPKIAEKIIELSKLEIKDDLKNYVIKNHNLDNLIKKIVNYLCAR